VASEAGRISLNDYELVAILNPEIEDENVTETVDRLTQFVTSRGGEVQNVDQWGRRRLAYPIGRQMEGTYVVTHLRLQPASAAELEANLRISEDVLRHLLVRYSPAEQAAALAASQRRRPRPMNEEQPDGAPTAVVSAPSDAVPPAESQGESTDGPPVHQAEGEAAIPGAEAIAQAPEAEPATATDTPAAEATEPEAATGEAAEKA
jgi:small subunit ribosomal protein S6